MKKILKMNKSNILLIVSLFILVVFLFFHIGFFFEKIFQKESYDNYNLESKKNKSFERNFFNLDKKEVKAVILRTPENFVKKSSAKKILDLLIENDINRIIILVKNDEDLPHMDSGEVFYESTIAPMSQDYKKNNFDALEYVINYTRGKSIEIYAWIPQFHDKVIINENKKNQMVSINKQGKIKYYNRKNEFFANPISLEVQNYQLSIIEEVIKNYDVQGIFIDWIRFDNYNMDLSESTRNIFKEKYGYDPIIINFSSDSELRREWNDFREDIIANYISKVNKLVKKTDSRIELGGFILPPQMKEVAQNPSKFEDYLDQIAPMLYYEDWGYEKNWITEKAIVDLEKAIDDEKKIVPVISVDSCNDKNLTKILIEKFSIYYCFYYWDWNENLLNNIN